MVGKQDSRRGIARRLAMGAVVAAGVTVVVAAPASAKTSDTYATMQQCRTGQTAMGASSFIAITKSCYSFIQQIPGGYDPTPVYRFEYRTRY